MVIAEILSYITEEPACIGNRKAEVDGLNFIDSLTTKKSVISYADNAQQLLSLQANPRVTVLLSSLEDSKVYASAMMERQGCIIVVENPLETFYAIHEALCRSGTFYPDRSTPPEIGKQLRMHPTAVIEPGVVIGDHVSIGAYTVVRSGSIIDSFVSIGNHCVIGSEGFQVVRRRNKEALYVTHTGQCHIMDNTIVGDNVCIAKSLFEGATQVGSGVRIDNLTQIAHNCSVGKNSVICAGVVFCGSCVVQEGVWIAPGTRILNQVTIGRNATVGLGSVVTRNVEPETLVYGCPAKVSGTR